MVQHGICVVDNAKALLLQSQAVIDVVIGNAELFVQARKAAEEALFMLVSCSSFINYLNKKIK